jgi:hypoxanthine phosphoribosyltransferase
MSAPEIIQIKDKKFKIEYPESKLDSVISELADRINKDYAGKIVTILVVLKGAMPFAIDLMKKLDVQCIVETISAKSYGDEMTSSGKVKITPPTLNVEGKEVIIVEDIVDTGRTLKALKEKLSKQNPASIEIAALFSKPAQRVVEIDVKYEGIVIPPVFIVGYGLDYAEMGRQYPAVYGLIED